MSATYDFPNGIQLQLTDGSETHVEMLRTGLGWAAVLVNDVSKTRFGIGSGLTLDGALDDLARGLEEAPPRDNAEDGAMLVASIRKLELLFTSDTFTMRVTRVGTEVFSAQYWDPAAAFGQSAGASSPAGALTELANAPTVPTK